ncbi:unnamed protein product [Phaedon cochleariae]|uniref:Prokaryotic-type class I peptide chain release factors domain-containing protein n=1 Tax=Phaedon cochleariae TaxID=80249 RepID=A0A9N9X312_PHACE|nr:unnamed protein product [Phaedon cochleariae]
MNKIQPREILKLYKGLLRYGQELKLTDKDFYQKRLIKEFKLNKNLTDEADIKYNFEINSIMLLQRHLRACFGVFLRSKHSIDYSRVPLLKDEDLAEMHVRGSGPGGQKINKTSSCVVLKHIPTGIVVKCQETRFLEQNRKIAHDILLSKVDNFYNRENSVEAQIKSIQDKKSSTSQKKKEKMKFLKEKWKERETNN